MFKFIKKIISKVAAVLGLGGNGDGGDKGSGSASKSAAGNSQGASAEQKEAKKKQWKDPNEDVKYVCHGGKVQCKYCNPPFANIIVTSETIMLQDKPWATVGDKDGKKNFGFMGVCMHPSQQKPFSPPPPCKAVISLGQWKDFSETIIGDHNALLVKSTIPCMISGEDLKIIHSGQMATLSKINPIKKKDNKLEENNPEEKNPTDEKRTKPTIKNIEWRDAAGEKKIDKMPTDGIITIYAEVENAKGGEKVLFKVKLEDGREIGISGVCNNDGNVEIKNYDLSNQINRD